MGDHPRHDEIALDGGDGRRVRDRRAHPRIQLAGRQQDDIGLAQAGENLVDVAQERGRRAHHEDAVLGEAVAVRVEQPRRAMQGHDGLPGAGPSLHHGDLVQWAADDAVLVGGDGGDDVVHASIAWCIDRSRGSVHRDDGRVGEVLVLGVRHRVITRDDAATSPKAHGVDRRGLVEAGGVGRAPVEEHGLTVGVAESDPSDALDAAVLVVDATEAQAILCRSSAAQLLGQVVVEGLLLEEVLPGSGVRGIRQGSDS